MVTSDLILILKFSFSVFHSVVFLKGTETGIDSTINIDSTLYLHDFTTSVLADSHYTAHDDNPDLLLPPG